MSRISGYISRKVLFAFLLFFALYGCSLFQSVPQEDERSAEELMSEGLWEFEDGNYGQAADAFQKLKDRYPYSKLAIEAELKFADSLFKRKAFEDALEAYSEFERLHPKDPHIPYIQYQKGMCSFKQIRGFDREQTHALRARIEFGRLINATSSIS